jgi:hypothetical protein
MREKRDKERFSYYYYTLQQQKEEMDVFKRKKELEKQAEARGCPLGTPAPNASKARCFRG